jgi:hypothetical protein
MSSLSVIPKQSSQEIAASASAALAKATIEAKFTMAMHRPRNFMDARTSILDSCKRPAFAARAMYRKKQGKKKDDNGRWVDNIVEGLNIRFAEMAIQYWRNVDVTATTVWEDDERRVVRIMVTDLESNTSYSDEASLSKTVERSSVREGQEILTERLNASGEKVFIVRATEDELANKINSAKSKAIRNSGLRLIPQDIQEESISVIKATNSNGGEDPKKASKSVCDAFAGIGVNPSEIEIYLGHSINTVCPSELGDLRAIYSTIRDGEAVWNDYRSADRVPEKQETRPAATEATKAEIVCPQRSLSDRLTEAGVSFDDFKKWAAKHQPGIAAETLPGYDHLESADAKRLLRAVDGIIAQIKEGGAK